MLRALLISIKLQSLLISAISVGVGTALASLSGPVNWGTFALALIGVVLLHGGTNVVNDYFDYRQNVDTTEVPGSYGTEGRVLIQGRLQSSHVLQAGLFLYALSLLIAAIILERAV